MSQIKFFYLRDQWKRHIEVPLTASMTTTKQVRGNPIACIAYERFRDPDVEGHDYVLYTLSIANPRDKFEKSKGREIAFGRLNKGARHPGFVIEEEANSTKVVFNILLDLADDDRLPKRVRNSAASWIHNKDFS